MQRGFKSRCEQVCKRYRKKLGVSLEEALPYEALANDLGVRVWTPHDVPGLDARSLRQLTITDSGSWSAVTVTVGSKRRIVVNSSHSERRIPNDVVHELAHLILDHTPARVDITEDGHLWLSTYGKEQEDEANWLSGTLLLPRDGLLAVYRRTKSVEATASQFCVSHDLVNWRMRMTGIARQLGAYSF